MRLEFLDKQTGKLFKINNADNTCVNENRPESIFVSAWPHPTYIYLYQHFSGRTACRFSGSYYLNGLHFFELIKHAGCNVIRRGGRNIILIFNSNSVLTS